jgi:hypothetical protein
MNFVINQYLILLISVRKIDVSGSRWIFRQLCMVLSWAHLINVNADSLKPTFLRRMHARTECPTREVWWAGGLRVSADATVIESDAADRVARPARPRHPGAPPPRGFYCHRVRRCWPVLPRHPFHSPVCFVASTSSCHHQRSQNAKNLSDRLSTAAAA